MTYSDLPTKDIIVEIKKLEMDHNNIKSKIVSLWDELTSIEKKYEIANDELKKRGVKND